MKKEYLNEERYQEINKKIKTKGTKIYNILLCIGIALVFLGIGTIVVNNTNNKNKELEIQRNKEEKRQALDAELENLKRELTIIKDNLINKKQELLNKGLTPSFDYNDGENYDLYIINKVLDPSFPHCHFDDYKKNELTADYCTLTNLFNGDNHRYSCDDNEIIEKYCTLSSELSKLKYDKTYQDIIPQSNRYRSTYVPFIMFGFFITFASLIFKFSLFSITHRREIAAYTAQQVMPLAQEGIEKMAPNIGSAAGTIGKEIAKGIKEGLEEDETKDAE